MHVLTALYHRLLRTGLNERTPLQNMQAYIHKFKACFLIKDCFYHGRMAATTLAPMYICAKYLHLLTDV